MIRPADAEGLLRTPGGQAKVFVRRSDRALRGRILRRKAEIVQRQAGLSGEYGRKHLDLLRERCHALLIKLPDGRLLSFLILAEVEECGHDRLRFVYLIRFI